MTTSGARLARSAAYGQIAKIAQSGIGLITALILARSLGPAGVGVYAYVFGIAVLIQMAASAGLEDLVLTRVPGLFSSGMDREAKGILKAAGYLRVRIAVALIATALLIALFGRNSSDRMTLTWSTIALGIAYAALNSLATLGLVIKAARLKALGPACLDTGWYFAVAAGVTGMAVLGVLTTYRAVVLAVVAEAVAVIGYVIIVVPEWRGSDGSFRDIPKKSVGVFWCNAILAYGIGKSLDLLLIRISGSSYSAVGLYNAAFNVFMLASTLLVASVGTFTQVGLAGAIGQGDPDRIARAWGRAVILMALVSFPALGFLAIRSKLAVGILFGNAFSSSGPALVVLAETALVIRALGGGISQGVLYSTNRQLVSLRIRVGTVLLNIMGDLLLIRVWGIAGVALATGVCGIITTLLEYRAAGRIVSLPYPARGIGAIALGTGLACVITFPVPSPSASHAATLALDGTIYAGAFYLSQRVLKPLGHDTSLVNQVPRCLRRLLGSMATE